MAQLTFTFATNTNAGAQIRKFAERITEAAAGVPDNNSSGAAVVLTVDNAPAGGSAMGVQVTGGPYLSNLFTV